MHFYISFIFTCVLIYTNMKGCLSFGNPSILKTSLFVHILDISATWIQQIALFFPFGNLKCWHIMTYPKESLLKTNEMLKTALSSFILVHRHVTGCVRWRMKHFLTDTKRSQKWITFSLLTHIQHSYQAKMPLQGSEQILILKRTKWDKVINARIERQQR